MLLNHVGSNWIFPNGFGIFIFRGQQTSSVDSERVNIFGFAVHRASVSTIQLCYSTDKTVINNT